MKTKTCPYCGKDLSGEAVLCKYCHNLLIDEDGNMTAEAGLDDDKTRVFKKPDDDDMTKRFVLPDTGSDDRGRGKKSGVIADARADDVFAGDDFDDYQEDDFDDSYDDYDDENDAKKRLFIITAVITIGVLVIVIAAILIGMRIVGKKDTGSTANAPVAAKPANSAAADESTDDNAGGQPADNTEASSAADNNVLVTDPNSSQGDSSDVGTDSQSDESKLDFAASSQDDSHSSAVNYADSNSDTDSSSSSQASDSSAAEVDVSELESTVRAAVAGEIGDDITGSQFRTEENGYAYYYFFTDDGAHGYSVAYNTATGDYVCEQNY